MSKVLLIILDGYGKANKSKGNAIELSKKPYIDELREKYPTALLKSAGNAVGLPEGFMGNSEVGHFTLGAGRIVYQTLEMINLSIKDKSFFKNPALNKQMQYAKKHNSKLHLLGMISDKGVHSHVSHLFALLELAKKYNLKKVYLHAITDGRDVGERTAKFFITKILNKMKSLKVGKFATIIGRYYAMDRDQNWKRTLHSYDLIVNGKGEHGKSPTKTIDHQYEQGIKTDYYIKPILLDKEGLIEKNDAVIFFNYRTDRSRQLTSFFSGDKGFNQLPNTKLNLSFACMGPYSKTADIAFKAPKIVNNLGEILSKHQIKQLRIAETEKYAHVTFFFNSQIKQSYPFEDRILIHSPKARSYADKPEMSAKEVTSKLIHEIHKDIYPFILLNYANGDLVGHSGDLKATIKCIEALNKYLKQVIPAALEKNYDVILTADHGKAEKMLYENGAICPAHSENPVECTLISKRYQTVKLKQHKGLQDVAPTVLNLLGIKQPKEMTGESLITNKPINVQTPFMASRNKVESNKKTIKTKPVKKIVKKAKVVKKIKNLKKIIKPKKTIKKIKPILKSKTGYFSKIKKAIFRK